MHEISPVHTSNYPSLWCIWSCNTEETCKNSCHQPWYFMKLSIRILRNWRRFQGLAAWDWVVSVLNLNLLEAEGFDQKSIGFDEGSGLRGWDFLGSGAIQAWWNCLQIERLRGGAYCCLWAWVIGYDWMGGKSNKKWLELRIIGIETLNRLLLFFPDSCVYLFKWALRSQGTLAAHEEHRTLLSVTGTPVLGLWFGTNWWREKHSEARPAANELILHYRFHKMQCF